MDPISTITLLCLLGVIFFCSVCGLIVDAATNEARKERDAACQLHAHGLDARRAVDSASQEYLAAVYQLLRERR